jgi:hypothetical protein
MDVRVMALAQGSLQVIEGLETIPQETSGPEALDKKSGKLTGIIERMKRYRLGVTFLAGLLVGWIVIGWWLWPVQWNNSEPWQLLPRHQQTFVRLVAEDYWLTGDISRARDALAGWNKQDLSKLLDRMEQQSSDPEERQHLIALAEALQVPTASEVLITSLLRQRAILLSFIVSVVPMVAAVALTVYYVLRNRVQQTDELGDEEFLDEELEELLGQEEEQIEQPVQQGQEEQGQEKQGTGEEEEEKTEEDEDEEDESSPWVQDLIADLFSDDDAELSRLEALCQKLPDVDTTHLLELAQKVVTDLFRCNYPRHIQ